MSNPNSNVSAGSNTTTTAPNNLSNIMINTVPSSYAYLYPLKINSTGLTAAMYYFLPYNYTKDRILAVTNNPQGDFIKKIYGVAGSKSKRKKIAFELPDEKNRYDPKSAIDEFFKNVTILNNP